MARRSAERCPGANHLHLTELLEEREGFQASRSTVRRLVRAYVAGDREVRILARPLHGSSCGVPAGRSAPQATRRDDPVRTGDAGTGDQPDPCPFSAGQRACRAHRRHLPGQAGDRTAARRCSKDSRSMSRLGRVAAALQHRLRGFRRRARCGLADAVEGAVAPRCQRLPPRAPSRARQHRQVRLAHVGVVARSRAAELRRCPG